MYLYVYVCIWARIPVWIWSHVHGTCGGQRSKSSVDSHHLPWLKQGLSQFTTVYTRLACLRGSRDFPILTLLLTTGIVENKEVHYSVQLYMCSCNLNSCLPACVTSTLYWAVSLAIFEQVMLSHPDIAWTCFAA